MVERLRGRAGQAQRLRRLEAHGVHCVRCGCLGVWFVREVTAALPLLQVNHKLALAQGGTDTDDNTEVICEPCHKAETADQFGKVQSKGLGGCDASGMPTAPLHPWNRGRG